MSRNVLVTINTGDFLRPNVRASYAHAAKRWGCEYLEITEPYHKSQHPYGMKLELPEHPALADTRALFVDADVVIRSDCPDPFGSVPSGYFAAAQNDQGDITGLVNHNQAEAWTFAQQCVPAAKPYRGWYINTGVFLFESERHRFTFDYAARLYEATKEGGGDDQTALALTLDTSRVPFYPLARMWNAVGSDIWQAWPKMPVWVTHYAKFGKEYRRENTAATMDAVQWNVDV